MKWVWVFIVVLLVPISVQAETQVIISKLESHWPKSWGDDGPALSQITLRAGKTVDHVRVSLFFKKGRAARQLEGVQQAQCVMVINQKAVPDMRQYLYYGDEGPELWLVHLNEGDEVLLGILWKKEHPKIGLIGMNVETPEETYYRSWSPAGSHIGFSSWWRKRTSQFIPNFSLDEICSSYTLEALKDTPFPKS